jgi:copper chaperone NosL
MRNLVLTAIIAMTLGACAAETEPMIYGKDNCTFCKMGIIDPKYGAEIVTKKGKVFKFDDVICLAHFLSSGSVKPEQTAHSVVINFEKENEFLDINTAAFWVSPELKSPMGSNAAAFVNPEAANRIKGDRPGEVLNWKTLSERLQ